MPDATRPTPSSRPARPTSHDVARLAGVSQTTVSYALNGRGTISAATRERVAAAAASLGYEPNLAARAMRTRRSGRLAVIIGMVAAQHQHPMLAEAAEVAKTHGYTVEIMTSEGDVARRSNRVRELAASGLYEGILTLAPVLPGVTSDGVGSTAVVALTSFDDKMHATGDLADASPIDTFVRELTAAGHRDFLHLAGSDEHPTARQRRTVYQAAVERYGARSLGVLGGDWSAAAGRQALLQIAEVPEGLAVIAASDGLAVGALRAASERGLSVPEDLVVTGWDDLEFGAYTSPSLTTVNVDYGKAGRNAMNLLLARLGGEPDPRPGAPEQRIIWRESTGGSPRPNRRTP